MMFTMLVALAELASAQAPLTRAASATEMRVARAEQAPLRVEPLDPLHNPRTGVTCTMRVLKAEPVDSHTVRPAPEASVDPGIRGRVSPCLD